MPLRENTGVPDDFGLTHFNSSTISGSASCIISRTLASVFPRQSPSSMTFSVLAASVPATNLAWLNPSYDGSAARVDLVACDRPLTLSLCISIVTTPKSKSRHDLASVVQVQNLHP